MLQAGPDGESVEGYAVMAGQNVATKVVTVFAEQTFRCIDPVLTPENRIIDEGVAQWFNQQSANFHADTYFQWQLEGPARPWTQRVYISKQIKPMPRFISVAWPDDDTALSAIGSLLSANGLRLDGDGSVAKEGADLRLGIARVAVRALGAVALGLNEYPWRRLPG